MFSDNTAPVCNNCPNALTVYADRGRDSTVGNWHVPVFTDNFDDAITPILSRGKSPGSRFSVGEHKIKYTASDKAGNEAVPCSFTFFVHGTSYILCDNCIFVISMIVV